MAPGIVASVIFVALAMLGGCAALNALPGLPGAGVVSTLFVSLCAVCLAARPRVPRVCIRIVVAGAAGFAWALASAVLQVASTPETHRISGVYVLEGFVSGVPQQTERGVRFRISVRAPVALSGHVVLSAYGETNKPVPGQFCMLAARLRPARGFANPGGFDLEAWAWRERVIASGYVVGDSIECSANSHRHYLLDRWRARLANSIDGAFGEAPDSLPLVKALSLGLRDDMTPAHWRTLQRSGTGHLLAISGLHVGLVAGFAFLLFRRVLPVRIAIATGRPPLEPALVASIVAAALYAALAGFSVPTRRALLMLTIAAGAVLSRRAIRARDVYAITLIVVLVTDPAATLNRGFWLSFGAVAVILLSLAARPQGVRLWRWLSLQLTLFIGLAPFVSVFFGSFAIVAPIVNALLIPYFTFVVIPLALAGVLLTDIVPSVGVPVLHTAVVSIDFAWPFVVAAANNPWAYQVVGQMTPAGMALLAGGSFLLLLAPHSPGRYCAGALLACGLSMGPDPPVHGAAQMTFLDVGQGLSVVIETARHVVVFDTGPKFASGSDAAQRVVIPFLHTRGVRRLDRIVVSHGDSDHAGGLGSLLEAYPDSVVTEGESCYSGLAWSYDGVGFEVVHPAPDELVAGNDASCVLRVTAGRHAVLLSADIERAGEGLMIARDGRRAVDIVLAPHHGSRTSSSMPFVAATRPEWVIFSAGYGNRWRFPRPAIVARWARAGARTLVTGTCGAVSVTIGPSEASPRVNTRRRDRRRFFHHQNVRCFTKVAVPAVTDFQ